MIFSAIYDGDGIIMAALPDEVMRAELQRLQAQDRANYGFTTHVLRRIDTGTLSREELEDLVVALMVCQPSVGDAIDWGVLEDDIVF